MSREEFKTELEKIRVALDTVVKNDRPPPDVLPLIEAAFNIFSGIGDALLELRDIARARQCS
jgi:hypothetical protein